jgi:hypothetical protein
MKKIYEIFGVIGLLAIAAVLDIVYQRTREVDPRLLDSAIIAFSWLRILGTVFITILLLAISWYLLYHPPHASVVTAVCILLGAITLLVLTIPGLRFVAQFHIFSRLPRAWLTDIVVSDLSLTSHSAAFILCIGVIRLLPAKFLKKICKRSGAI